MNGTGTEHFETVIIGGGQAGLVTGYHLATQGRSFVILDGNERVGDAWRKRWDSLRLFTPAKYDGLAGWRFPAGSVSFPTKDEMADYLEAYAARFDLPVRTGVAVDGLSRMDDRYLVTAGGCRLEADQVVVATGAHHVPRVPAFAAELGPGIVQLHSSRYRSPAQLGDGGGVLVVGVGNSGAEIALEVSRAHRTWLSGIPSGQIPVRHGPAAARLVLPIIRFLGTHVLTLGTPIGRKLRPELVSKGPLIRVKLKDLAAAGVEHVARTVGVRDGLPRLADGRVLDVSTVIWCTGFRSDFGWIDLPVFDDDGMPIHGRGVVEAAPGLYFVGLQFQYAAVSDVLPGVGRDAEYVVRHIASCNGGSRPGTPTRDDGQDLARTSAI